MCYFLALLALGQVLMMQRYGKMIALQRKIVFIPLCFKTLQVITSVYKYCAIIVYK